MTEKRKGLPHFLDIGTCGLHTRGSFKAGIEKQRMANDISYEASFNKLHDSPARQDDYEIVKKSSKFSLLFCAVRWIEDVAVVDGFIEV